MNHPDSPGRQGLPLMFLLLCILSITGNAAGILIHIMVFFGQQATQWLMKIPVMDSLSSEGLEGGKIFAVVKILAHAFVIYSLALMLKRKRGGFILYLTAQAVLLLIPFLFLNSLGINYLLIRMGINFIFTVFFILLFSRYLQWLSS